MSDDELDRAERVLDRVENSQVFNEALRDGENPYVTVVRAEQRRTASTRAVDRCPDCGKVPGKWQPTVGGRRDELTLEECRTCGAAWTGRIGARG